MLYRAKGTFSLEGGNLAQAIKGGPPVITLLKTFKPDVYNQCRQL
jgi:hypothetical protein